MPPVARCARLDPWTSLGAGRASRAPAFVDRGGHACPHHRWKRSVGAHISKRASPRTRVTASYPHASRSSIAAPTSFAREGRAVRGAGPDGSTTRRVPADCRWPATGSPSGRTRTDPRDHPRCPPAQTSISRKAAWLATEEQVLGETSTSSSWSPASTAISIPVARALSGDRVELGRRAGRRPLQGRPLRRRGGCAASVAGVAIGVPVHVASALTGEVESTTCAYLTGNRTVALLGSSGVGKSTPDQPPRGEDVQAVAEVRNDGRGRHTTTTRERPAARAAACRSTRRASANCSSGT